MSSKTSTSMLRLPFCPACQKSIYPVQACCDACLNDRLEWREIEAPGAVISWTLLHASGNEFIREHLPWRVVLVKLDCGPVLFAHAGDNALESGSRVRVLNRLDRSGQGVLIAVPEQPGTTSSDHLSALLQEPMHE